jgi:hypothetical protein
MFKYVSFMRSFFLTTACLILSCAAAPAANSLVESFNNPEESAKPLIIWQWMNGVVSREGITADLEAYKRAGLGGVQNFQVGGWNQALAEDVSIQIGNAKWQDAMRFAIDECARLGLTFGTHNCPGWSSSASPEVKVEDSMQKLVWSEVRVSGGSMVSLSIDQPKVDSQWNYYRDIAVLGLPEQSEVPVKSVIDLTDKMDSAGKLRWDAPAGKWIILRFGHTTAGKTNENTSPESGLGLECDKMSRSALEHYWAGYPSMLLNLAGRHAGKTFNRIEIDSYEPGPQNWTPDMLAEFKRYRGYDLLAWLPALANKKIGSEDLRQRFRHDWNLTISELFADNYYLYMDELARRTPGMKLLVQPYGNPVDTQASSGGQSLLCAEFWTRPDWGWNSVLPVTSAAHTLGKPLVYGEGFTTWPLSAWQDDPYSLKPVGDRAFSEGINRLMLHAAAQNPWPNAKPGMTFGKWGVQFSPGQTWWNNAGPKWIAYLTRCQALLQRGLCVKDLCYLQENSKRPNKRPKGWSGDSCGIRAFLTRLSVEDGKLLMPDGMSYRMLILPNTWKMSVEVARKLRALVKDGAIVIGPKPFESLGLTDYPACDSEVQKIGEEVWGDCNGKTIKENRYGKGIVFWGKSVEEVLNQVGIQPDVQIDGEYDIRWIHRAENESDFYFISNRKNQPVELTASFRSAGRVPELWHADTGEMEPAPYWQKNEDRTEVLLDLDQYGSVFVVFRKPATEREPGLKKAHLPAPTVMEVDGPWVLRFPDGWGAPEQITLEQLESWAENKDLGVKYFSGTATYVKDINLPQSFAADNLSITIDLGTVKNIAQLFVNGQNCGGVLWKPPFRADISHALKDGVNRIEIYVTNLWPNRMIGDELEPDDMKWGEPFKYPYAPGEPVIGRFLAEVPEWLTEGKPRPSQNRRTVVSFKFFTKDSPLLPSGILGPITLEAVPCVTDKR